MERKWLCALGVVLLGSSVLVGCASRKAGCADGSCGAPQGYGYPAGPAMGAPAMGAPAMGAPAYSQPAPSYGPAPGYAAPQGYAPAQAPMSPGVTYGGSGISVSNPGLGSELMLNVRRPSEAVVLGSTDGLGTPA